MEADDFIKQAASRWLNEHNRRNVSRRGNEGKLHQMDTESSDNASAVAMQDSSTQADLKLTKSVESLKENFDAAVKMFQIYDSTAVDSNDDEDEIDYLFESSGSEAD